MTLSCENPWPKRTFGPGIFVNEATVVEVEDLAGVTLPYLDRPYDIGFRLTLEVGKDFKPQLIVAGNLKRDLDTGEIIGWGGAFVVQEALTRLGYRGQLTERNTIPPQVLRGLVGQKILRLSYASGVKDNGKTRYYDWNQVGSIEEGPEALVKRFTRSLERGYPKNYKAQRRGTNLTANVQKTQADLVEDPF